LQGSRVSGRCNENIWCVRWLPYSWTMNNEGKVWPSPIKQALVLVSRPTFGLLQPSEIGLATFDRLGIGLMSRRAAVKIENGLWFKITQPCANSLK